MKDLRLILTALLASTLSISALTACSPIDGNNSLSTGEPEGTQLYIQNFRPISTDGTLSRVDGINDPAKTDDPVIIYGGYDQKLTKPTMKLFHTYDEFNAGIIDELTPSSHRVDASGGDYDTAYKEQLAKFDAKYFEQHFAIVINLKLTSGSARVSLGSMMQEDGVTKIYLTSFVPGDVGTCDMASAHILLGMDRAVFDPNAKIEVYLNKLPLEFASANGDIA